MDEIHREYCNRKADYNLFDLLGDGSNDSYNEEIEKTYFTEERFLPRILVDIGIYPSISEIRRNRPNLMKSLDRVDFLDALKVSKKRKLWIVVGE